MKWNVAEGNWKPYVGKVKEQWGKGTDDHIASIVGKREQLAGKIQEAYKISLDKADKKIKQLEMHLKN